MSLFPAYSQPGTAPQAPLDEAHRASAQAPSKGVQCNRCSGQIWVANTKHLHLPMPADATLQAAAAYFLSSSSSDEGEDATGAQANPRKAVRETAAGSVSSDTSKQHRRRRHRKRGRDDAGDGHKQACILEDALRIVLSKTCHTSWYAPPASGGAQLLQGMSHHCKLLR